MNSSSFSFPVQIKAPGEKAKRAPREILTNLSHAEKMERRKERARVYSHIARRRQEGFLSDLTQDVEHLAVFRMMVDELPDCIMMLDRNMPAPKILFVEGAFARQICPIPADLVGHSLWSLLHPEDVGRVRTMVSAVNASKTEETSTAKVKCRMLTQTQSGPGQSGKYLQVEMALRLGTQGVICMCREDDLKRLEK